MALDDDVVGSYFCMDKRINKTKERMRNKRLELYGQSLTTRAGFRDEQPATIAFNIEQQVTNHVTTMQMAELHIQVLEFKQDHFKRFWDSLDTNSQYYYTERYLYETETINDRLDRLIVEEVGEIEEAVKYYFNLDIEVFEDKSDFNIMLKLLGV